MTAPLWGHKPPRVADVEEFWMQAPPSPSERCMYWVRRMREGTWTPNRFISDEGYYGRASKLGVWIWEANEVIFPIHCISAYGMRAQELLRTYRNSPNTVPYWQQLTHATRPVPCYGDAVTSIYAWWSDWQTREQHRTWDANQ